MSNAVWDTDVEMAELDALTSKTQSLVYGHLERRRHRDNLAERVQTLTADVDAMCEKLDRYIRASQLVGETSDKMVSDTLDVVTGIINKALTVIFPQDPREIKIVPSMHKKIYPHFNVVLYAGVLRRKRTFELSGTGLAQIVALLFDVSLIDVRGGRPLIVLDEVMSGLHPAAKELMKELITALSKRFQFILMEYGMDMGQQYEVVLEGTVSTVQPYLSEQYYLDYALMTQDKKKAKGE